MKKHLPISIAEAGSVLDGMDMAPPFAPLMMPKQVLQAEHGFLRRLALTVMLRIRLTRRSVRRML